MQRNTTRKDNLAFAVIGIFLVFGMSFAVLLPSLGNWRDRKRARELQNPVAATPEAVEAGRKIYRSECEKCHGLGGNGKGEKAADLAVAPTAFTDQGKMRTQTDGELFWEITKGRRPMPAYEDKLSQEARWQAVDYIRTLSGQTPRGASAESPVH